MEKVSQAFQPWGRFSELLIALQIDVAADAAERHDETNLRADAAPRLKAAKRRAGPAVTHHLLEDNHKGFYAEAASDRHREERRRQ